MPGGSHFESIFGSPQGGPVEVYDLMQDSDGAVWCATGAGLYRITRPGGQLTAEPIPLRPGASVQVKTLLKDPQGRIWAGSIDGLYCRMTNGQVLHLGRRQHAPVNVAAMLMDGSHRLWVGGEGLATVDLESDPPTAAPACPECGADSVRVFALHRDARGRSG
jgi:ligand-binding sensor domain-containing protein